MTTTQDETIKALQRQLDRASSDWDTRAILADRYEDLDDLDHAELQRWMARYKKRPIGANWYFDNDSFPSSLGYGIQGNRPKQFCCSTRRLAEEALLEILLEVGFDYIPPETFK